MFRRLPGAVLLALCLCTPVLAGVPVVLLDCDFDSEPLDTEIGTGGPALGQPISAQAPSFVRGTPFATPSLEIGDDSPSGAQYTRFEFLNDASISTGMLTISMNVWLHTPGQYFNLNIRERQFSAQTFTNLRFNGSGGLQFSYEGSPGYASVGTFPFNAAMPVVLTYDLDAETVSISVDGTEVVTDSPFGGVPVGIGAILFGFDHDADSLGTISVDDLLVTSTNDPSPVAGSTWGRLKTLWR